MIGNKRRTPKNKKTDNLTLSVFQYIILKTYT